MLFSMISVPELASDPQFFSRDLTFVNDLFDSFTALFFVSVVTSFVNASIACVGDSVINCISNLILWDLPAAQAD